MPYTPDPDDATAPLESVLAGTAAAEFRAFKEKINNVFLQSAYDTPGNIQPILSGLTYIKNIPAGTYDGIFYGYACDVTRNDFGTAAPGGEGVVGAQLNARLGNNLDGLSVNFSVFGLATEAWTGEIASHATLIGAEHGVISQYNANEMALVGEVLTFKNRSDARVLAGLGPVQGLGADKYNANARAMQFSAFPRSPDGERCGWGRGLVFTDSCFDEYYDTILAAYQRPVGIDFREQDGPFTDEPWTAYITPLKSGLSSALALPEYMSITWDREQFTRTYLDSDNDRMVLFATGASPTTVPLLCYDYTNNYITFPNITASGAPSAATHSMKIKVGAAEFFVSLTAV